MKEKIPSLTSPDLGKDEDSVQVRITVKPVLSRHSKKHQKLFFNTDHCLIEVKSIAECSKGSILQYFRPPLSYISH